MQGAPAFILGLVIGATIVASLWFTGRRLRSHRSNLVIKETKEAAEEHVMSVLDTLPESFILCAPHEVILQASALAQSFGLINEGQLRSRLAGIVADVFASGVTQDVEFDMVNRRQRHKGARRIWVRVAKASASLVVVLFEDKTEQLRLDQTRRDFVSNISHELKTPIGGIKLLAETLQGVTGDPELVLDFAQKLECEADRLNGLVQEIIQLSRLQEMDALIDPEIVSVDAVIEEAVARMQVEAQSRQITLFTGGEQGQEVLGDFVLLVTAVRNLLDNAVRYSSKNSRVSVVVSTENDHVSIAVIDAGLGISDEEKKRVFERFYRGDRARSRDTGGTGLGLSIVKHVVNDHGGSIKLWSELGQGSTFTIILPRVQEGQQEQPAADQPLGDGE